MPSVSIVLPTFNRARFLPEAIASIRAQSLTDWELVIVDDGSTDDTAVVVSALVADMGPRVSYVRRENGGAYAARNTGLDHARGTFVAFFDSDDLWLPHHLERCVRALEQDADVDWVFAACRRVDVAGRVVDATTFSIDGRPRPFLALEAKTVGPLHVIVDRHAAECHLEHGIFCGLQNSVIRRGVFDQDRFREDSRVVEDAIFLLRALLRGTRLGYLTDVHVVYRIHESNSTSSTPGNFRAICQEQVHGLERVRASFSLSRSQLRSLRFCLARHYFWHLGYVACWQAGDKDAALAAMRKGLELTPWNVKMWKTYAVSQVKASFSQSLTHRGR